MDRDAGIAITRKHSSVEYQQMTRRRGKEKGRREGGRFLALPHAIINSDVFTGLSAHAVKLLIDLSAQYCGNNNGDFSGAWTLMHRRGWRSRDTLTVALNELMHVGLIEKTRQGGRNRCNLFAVTWLAIDDCRGKLDVCSTNVPSGQWKKSHDKFRRQKREKKLDTSSVSIKPVSRVVRRILPSMLTRLPCMSELEVAMDKHGPRVPS